MSSNAASPWYARWAALPYLVIAWLSLGEWRAYDRLLFRDEKQYGFVLDNIQGILEGRPVSKSWQHRFLPAHTVAWLDGFTGDRLSSLKLFSGVLLLAAHALLFHLLRRRGTSVRDSLFAVLCFGLVRLLLTFRLEYPWDAVDILLFLAFGYWAATDRSLLSFVPMLLVGLFNHETILYVPLWYLAAPLDRKEALGRGKMQLLAAFVAAVALAGSILALRDAFYLGPPNWPGQAFEEATAVISNHLHLGRNLKYLLFKNWLTSNAFVSVALLSAIALFVRGLTHPAQRRAAAWSLIVIATILCFGYVGEMRHYLLLTAFWFTYAWPAASQPPTRVTA